MPAWFSKVFKTPPPQAATPTASSRPTPPAVVDLDADDDDQPRRVLNAPVLVDTEAQTAWSDTIRIKARLDDKTQSVVFLVDRPVLDGYSIHCADADFAGLHAPLAAALFQQDGVATVTLHGMTVTVTRAPGGSGDLESFARAAGNEIRAHLQSGMPAVSPDFLEGMPSEEDIRVAIQRVIDEDINPGIAGHSGYITLNRVTGNTIYITMGGGCQGCAASSITLRGGVEREFREAMPYLGAILDETDHASGVNPYFTALPAGAEG
jgi:Fe-S cluster biogenesis protein NfuA